MMELGFDEKRVDRKRGSYRTIDAIHLADPSLQGRATDYKRKLSGRMRAVAAQDIGRVPAERGYLATRKYDGEFALVFYDGKTLLSVNPGGTVRMGLPCLDEAEDLLKKAGVKSCILAGEFYAMEVSPRSRPIHQVLSILRNPKSAAAMNKLGFAVFDVVELNGKKVKGLDTIFSLLEKWFGKGELARPVDHTSPDDLDDVMELLTDWVIGEGSEGIVLMHDRGNWYKIKVRHNIDAAIIGYSEGSERRKGLLHDLLVAVVRDDGTFQELTRVGGGFTEDERREIAAEMKRRIVPSDYVAVNNDYVAYEMVKPGPVIEMSCLDLISESSRGRAVNRMVLKFDGKRYTALSRMPLVSVVSPQFVRMRDDKEAVAEDVNIRQVTELVPVAEIDRPAEDPDSEPSTLLEREVYTKVMQDNLMVRKLLMWKTNKDELTDHPAYVVFLTDFSPNRKEPLQHEVRVAPTKAAARKHFERLAGEYFLSGWEKANGPSS